MIASPPVISSTDFDLQTWSWQGHDICHTSVGSGPPLVLVHGFGASIGHWRRNASAWADAGYQVFVLDLLGFGSSAKPPLEYSLELWEALLRDYWHEHVGEPAVFIGNSIGALLSLMMVARSPELTRGAVLLNCAGGLNHRPDELPFFLRGPMAMFTNIATSSLIGPLLFNVVRQKHQIRRSLKQVYDNQAAVTDELVEMLYRPSCDPGAQKVFAAILRGPAGSPPEELLPLVDRPLLVAWGEKDPWTPVDRGRLYEKYSDLVKFVPISNAGHCPHDERPEVVNPLVLDWLATLSFD